MNELTAYSTALMKGDLSKLTDVERQGHYNYLCETMGLNPATQPFEYINLNGKLKLYALKNCTDQLRNNHKISIQIEKSEQSGDLFLVIARAFTPDGRQDEEIGAVNIKNLSGDNLANAIMKAYTKAKRRVTLSIVGLSTLDESEIDSIPEYVKEKKIGTSPVNKLPDPYLTQEQKELLSEVKLQWKLTDENLKNYIKEKTWTSKTIPSSEFKNIIKDIETGNLYAVIGIGELPTIYITPFEYNEAEEVQDAFQELDERLQISEDLKKQLKDSIKYDEMKSPITEKDKRIAQEMTEKAKNNTKEFIDKVKK